MKVYIAYKFSNEESSELREKLENLDEIVKSLGFETFIFQRDVKNWDSGVLDSKIVVEKAVEELKKCDVLVCFIDGNEKSEGLLLECGYFKGLGKKVVLVVKKDVRYVLLREFVDDVIEFEDMNDSIVRDRLKVVLEK